MRVMIIPAYEPDERLLQLLAQAREQYFQPLVVDDGSGSAYEDIFRRARDFAEVLSYPVNQGKGHAMKAAFRYLHEKYGSSGLAYTVVIADCDGQHRVCDAARLCAESSRTPAALILGSRRQGSDSPLRSRFGNAVTRNVCRLITGRPIYDTQTGLRAFSSDLLPAMLTIEGERYEYEMNMLLYCSRHGLPVREVPIETIYFDNNAGSHFRTLQDSLRIYSQLLLFTASSLLGFVIDYALFSLLTFLSGGAWPLAANIIARVFSASVNFTVNRYLVFDHKDPFLKSAAQYALLAAGILAANSAILLLFTEVLGLNTYLAKLLTEMTLFICSFTVQKLVIFRKPGQKHREAARHEA